MSLPFRIRFRRKEREEKEDASLVTNKLTPSVTQAAPFYPLHRPIGDDGEGIKVIRFGPLIGNPCNLKRNQLVRRKGGRVVLSLSLSLSKAVHTERFLRWRDGGGGRFGERLGARS